MPKSSFDVPPDFQAAPEEFKEFVLELFNHLYGLGSDVTGQIDVDNSPNEHANNRDTFLDQGGVNEVTAANAADAVTKKHTQGTDQGLDTGGPNASTAVNVADAVTKKHDPGSSHNLLKQSAALADLAALSTTGTADLSYTANERDMLNNIKTDLGNIKTKIDTLLANHRTADIQAT